MSDATFLQQGRLKSSSDTACLRCRHHKIKCSRETPSCERCLQRESSCHYPRPPNRKYLAQHRARPNFLRFKDIVHDQDQSDASLNLAHADPTREPQTEHARVHPDLEQGGHSFPTIMHPELQKSPLPERELGLFLIEVYFSHFFTASFLFDYEALVRDYNAQKIPEYLLLAIYAFASLFLRPGSGSPFAKKSVLEAFASVGKQGCHWANASSQAVLIQADLLSISKVRACEILAVYWFAVGELNRAEIHAAISRTSYRLVIRQSRRRRKDMGLQEEGHDFVGDEMSRVRCAIWIKACLMDSNTTDEAEDSELPAYPNQLAANGEGGTMTEAGSLRSMASNVDWMTWGDDASHVQSSAIHVLKLLSLWYEKPQDPSGWARPLLIANLGRREVRLLVRPTRKTRPRSHVQSVFELETKLRKAYAAIPAGLKSDDLMSSIYPDVEKTQRNSMHLHAIYHLCLILLHSSMVSLGPGEEDDISVSPALSDSCARTVAQHAISFAELVRKYLATVPDFSKVPCFVGYCASIAGHVHTLQMELEEDSQSKTPHTYALICGFLLSELKIYYPVLNGLWQDLKARMLGNGIDPLEMTKDSFEELVFSPRPVDSPHGTTSPTFGDDPKHRRTKNVQSAYRRSLVLRTYFQLESNVWVDDVYDEIGGSRQEEHSQVQADNRATSSAPTFEIPSKGVQLRNLSDTTQDRRSRDSQMPQHAMMHDDPVPLNQAQPADRRLANPWFFQDAFMNDQLAASQMDGVDDNMLISSAWSEPFSLNVLDANIFQHLEAD